MGKKIIALLLAVVLAACAVSVFADQEEGGSEAKPSSYFTKINFMQKDIEGKAQGRSLTAEDELVSENENFGLYLNRKMFGIKVKNKKTGYVWSSIPEDNQLHGMSFEWQRFAQSMVVGDFIIVKSGAEKQVAIKHASAKPPEIRMLENGFCARVNFYEAKAYCDIVITLTAGGISAEIPADSIEVPPDYALSAIYMMPFLGAVYGDEFPGYMFVPDGSGALIRFAKPRYYPAPYSARVYGDDLGLKGKPAAAPDPETAVPPVEDERVSLPVFGIAHGKDQDAFLAVVSGSDYYSEIVASAAGTMIDFSWACARFVYRETYWQPTSNASGFNMLQPDKNAVDAKVDYYFLAGDQANYVGMANTYRSLLVSEGSLVKKIAEETKDIPLKLDPILSEQAGGFFSPRTKTLTTLADVSGWVDELKDHAITNLIVALEGFEKKGYSGHPLGSFKLEGTAGGEKELGALYSKLDQSGGKLVLQTELTKGYEHQLNRKDIKLMASREAVTTREFRNLYQTLYYVNEKTLGNYINSLKALGPYKKQLALDSIGGELYSDYKNGMEVNRMEAWQARLRELETAAGASDFLLLENPNQYAFRFADMVYDLPMSDSRLIYETDAVPFLQIVLSGYVDSFSPYLNFGTNTADDLLRLVDYNTYPAYVLSDAYSSEFADTNMNDIYSSRYADWKGDIMESYKFVNGFLSGVRGSGIAFKKVPADGISITGYQNGAVIAVNFTEKNYTCEGSVVEAKTAKLIKEGRQ